MPPRVQRQTHKHISRDEVLTVHPWISLPRCGSANQHVLWVSGRGGVRSSMHLSAGTSPALLPPRPRFAACQIPIISLQEASNTWDTFYKYYGGKYTWSSPIYWCAFTAPKYLRWTEKRWVPGALEAPGQTAAEDALAHSVSWESKNSQHTKNMPPSAGGDQPRHPTAKRSLSTGRPSEPPVNQNGLRCSQQQNLSPIWSAAQAIGQTEIKLYPNEGWGNSDIALL